MGKQRDLFRFVTHFWETVQRGGHDECWPWTGARSNGKYGTVTWTDPATGTVASMTAHRVAHILLHGAIPYGKIVMHSCDNPPCCNPAHLTLGTVAENNRDRSLKGRTARPGVGNWNTQRDITGLLRGEAHPSAKLTDEQVRQIRHLCAEGRLRQRDIGARFGVSQGTVMHINTGRIWKHVA